MAPTHRGSFHLFRLAGIDVYLHWSWFIVAVLGIQMRRANYSSLGWNAIEYISLFAIVLMHEFGHSLACRQVGGRANQIVLWPLGGVAYVAPPPKPGPTLWSIAAGPLVNVGLIPVFTFLVVSTGWLGWGPSSNAHQLLKTIWQINFLILIFNLLPIYPLDGGQILRAVLWFIVGRARSLFIAAMIGFAGVAVMLVLAVLAREIWVGILALFILLNCTAGLFQARMLARAEKQPRRHGFICPVCREPPVTGPFWRCQRCMQPFDPFDTQATCPRCGGQFPLTSCLECGEARPLSEWIVPAIEAPPRI
jgi:Zn-dependent protease